MRLKLTIILILFITTIAMCQSATNSGAVSTNELIATVGEVFVLPVNDNEINSGSIGAVSIIEFNALSIDEVVAEKNIKFYPNPSTGALYLESSEMVIKNISVYDINGRLMSEISFVNNKVDLSSLQPGVYLIQLNDSTKQNFKIIKK